MIKLFLKYNRKKAILAFKITSMIFGLLVTILLISIYYTNKLPDIVLMFYIYLFSFIVFPLFILYLTYSSWSFEAKRLNYFLNKEPYIRLESLGFENVLINEKSKWTFASETKIGEVNGYKMYCIIPEKRYDTLGFSVPLQFTRRKLSEYKSIEKRLKEKGIEFNNSFATKLYKENESNVSIKWLEKELQDFTLALKYENLLPDKTNTYGLF